MQIWNFEKENLKLYEELLKIDSNVERVFFLIYTQLKNYDPQIFEFWSDAGLESKINTYLLRYIAPLYDLSKTSGKYDVEPLVIQLLSCVTWRTFDNCVDSHDIIEKGHQTSLIATMYLFDYAKNVSNKNILPILKHHVKLMNEQSIFEKKSPIKLEDTWKRCSIFLFAAEEIANIDKENIEIYKQYINYCGLAHDVHDFFSDIKGSIISLPVYWMNQINPNSVFSINRMRNLYERVREEVKPIEIMFNKINVENKFPLLNHFLKESRETFYSE